VVLGANPPTAAGVAMLLLFGADWKWKFRGGAADHDARCS
jgi:hypothetical protein